MMQFNSEEKRKLHPQASLIPYNVWLSYNFGLEGISELEIDLMQKPLKNLDVLFDESKLRSYSEGKKIRLWLAIFFAHSDMSDDFFIRLMDKFKLSSSDQLDLAVASGQINLVEKVIEIFPDQVLSMIEAKRYHAFIMAADGHFEIVNLLFKKLNILAPEQVKSMIEANNYGAFSLAAMGGHLEIVNLLIEQLNIHAPEQVKSMIEAQEYKAFFQAARCGHLKVMMRLIDVIPDGYDLRLMSNRTRIEPGVLYIKDLGDKGLQYTVKYNDQIITDTINAQELSTFGISVPFPTYNVIKQLKPKLSDILNITSKRGHTLPDEVPAMIKEDNYGAFSFAAMGGHLEIVKLLIEQLNTRAPEQAKSMIEARGYNAFTQASFSGHLHIMEQLMDFIQDQVLAMISANDYSAFKWAARGGHLDIMERLIEKLNQLEPDKMQSMILADNNAAFREAAEHGHLDVMERLMKLAPEQVNSMISAGDYAAFKSAAKGGYIKIVNLLINRLKVLAPDQIESMVSAKLNGEEYAVFILAAENGHLDIMERLMELVPAQVPAMIAAGRNYFGKYLPFRKAAGAGHLDVMNRLMKAAPEEVQVMISEGNYAAFRKAAIDGHLDVINRLMELAPDKIQFMITAINHQEFSWIAKNGHLHVMERLIDLADDKMETFINREGFRAFAEATGTRQLSVVNCLLQFPSVFAWAELHDREYGENFIYPFVYEQIAALRTAHITLETIHPQDVFDVTDPEKAKLCFYIIRNLIRQNRPESGDYIRFLLEIPTVKALAHTAVTPGMSNELVRLALTTGNQLAAGILMDMCPDIRALAAENNFYHSEARGQFDLRTTAQDRESSMRALSTSEQNRMAAAISRYQPIIKDAGGVDSVFETLKSQLAERYQANPARIRTGDGRDIDLPLDWEGFNALRLSAETRERAMTAYYENKDHTALRYLSKRNYWMDPHADYVDQQLQRSTFESYKPLIAMLWTAAKDEGIAPIDGYTVESRADHFIDELAHIGRAHNWDGITGEESDDKKGDKPSCYSGVKRRLFQSVLGHPLLKILTLDDIKQELREYVREYFTQHITDNNCDVLQTAWTDLCEAGKFDPCLKELNILPKEQDDFIKSLKQPEKYRLQFKEEPHFEEYIRKSFEITPVFQAHAIRFAAETRLDDLLKARQAQKPPRVLTTDEIRAKRIERFDEIKSKAQDIKNRGDTNSKGMEP